MKKRTVLGVSLILALAALLAILTVAAAQPTSRKAAASEPYGWVLQLRSAKHNEDLTSAAFRFWALHGGGQVAWTDASVTPSVTYKGIALYRLVGRIDDGNPNTFNTKRANRGRGYDVVIQGIDGYSVTFTSKQVAKVGKHLLVADRVDGMPLSLADVNQASGSATPVWPLKLVSGDPSVTGKLKISGIARISIVPAHVTVASTKPFGWLLQLRNTIHGAYRADATYKDFGNWASVKKWAVTWTDTSVTPSVTYKGIPLYRLVGRIDDKNPNAFSYALAGGTGYDVVVTGLDGFAATFTSAQVAAEGNALMLAYRQDGQPLVFGTTKAKNGTYSYAPQWPLKVVSSDTAITGKLKPTGVARVAIVAVPTPSSASPSAAPRQAAAPF